MFKYLLQNNGHINTEKHFSNCGKTLSTPQQVQENQGKYIKISTCRTLNTGSVSDPLLIGIRTSESFAFSMCIIIIGYV